jgi:hypothetical protein
MKTPVRGKVYDVYCVIKGGYRRGATMDDLYGIMIPGSLSSERAEEEKDKIARAVKNGISHKFFIREAGKIKIRKPTLADYIIDLWERIRKLI